MRSVYRIVHAGRRASTSPLRARRPRCDARAVDTRSFLALLAGGFVLLALGGGVAGHRDAQGVLWDYVEVLTSGAPALTPASDGSGAASLCSDTNPGACHPCRNGGTCGWVQDVFVR